MKELSLKKKVTYGVLFGLDAILSMFFLITSIIMIATMPDRIERALGHYPDNFIGYFQQNPNIFMFSIVIPMIILFVANIGALLVYVFKTNKKSVSN